MNRNQLLTKAQGIANAAEAAGRQMNAAEQAEVKGLLAQIKALDVEAKAQADLVRTLAGESTIHGDPGEFAPLLASGSWAAKAGAELRRVAEATGSKAMLPANSEISVPPALLVALPEHPRTLLDLIAREALTTGPNFEYLRQLTFDDKAAVVPELGLKPTSTATWDLVKGSAVTIATISEQLPNQWLRDYANVIAVLTNQMEVGVLRATEELVLNGNGAAEPKGILNTTGVAAVSFDTDALTTLAGARLTLELADVQPNALVLHPEDLNALNLTREGTGATAGGFLVDSDAWTRLIGAGTRVVTSTKLTPGEALLGDFSVLTLMIRDQLLSAAFAQHADWAAYNATLIRSEMRVGIRFTRPGAIAKVALTAGA